MSDKEFIDVPGKDEWNEVPQSDLPVSEPQAGSVSPEEVHETQPVYQENIPPEPEPLPSQPVPPLYDPVKEEHDPYVEAPVTKEGFTSTPVYKAAEPPKEKKNKGLIIFLIILLVLCVCLLLGFGVIGLLVASGRYTIEWSYLINDVVKIFLV